jgi:hypothetical protein
MTGRNSFGPGFPTDCAVFLSNARRSLQRAALSHGAAGESIDPTPGAFFRFRGRRSRQTAIRAGSATGGGCSAVRRIERAGAGAHSLSGDDPLTPVQRRPGLPIGNPTSQLFANIYLDGIDRTGERLRVKGGLDEAFEDVERGTLHAVAERCRRI